MSISLYHYAKTQHDSCLFRELRAGLHVDAATELLPHNRVLFRVDSMPTSAASPCMHEGGTAAPSQLALAVDSSRRCRSTAPRRLCIHRSPFDWNFDTPTRRFRAPFVTSLRRFRARSRSQRDRSVVVLQMTAPFSTIDRKSASISTARSSLNHSPNLVDIMSEMQH